MWTAAALAVAAALTAIAWLGDDPPEHRVGELSPAPTRLAATHASHETTQP